MFTNKEKEALRQSPYIQSVGDTIIRYTETFKETFSQMTTDGIKPREIFQTLGIDPKIVGSSRISEATRAYTDYQPVDQERLHEEKTLRRIIKEKEHQIALLTAENDFLKKKITLSLGGNPLSRKPKCALN